MNTTELEEMMRKLIKSGRYSVRANPVMDC